MPDFVSIFYFGHNDLFLLSIETVAMTKKGGNPLGFHDVNFYGRLKPSSTQDKEKEILWLLG
ncbi:MAG: hypothetical protein V3U54_01870 [Thermodesulfobacteriota bacterium]